MISKSNYSFIFFKLFLYLSIITSPYDVFLTIEFGGFTFRFTQLMVILAAGIFLCTTVSNGILHKPYGFGLLTLYVILNTVFLVRAKYMSESIGYELWLLLNYVLVLMITDFFSKSYNTILELMRVYINSFFLYAIVLMCQVVVYYTTGLRFGSCRSLGSYVRFSAFTFEPSFYSTYMIIGWILLCYLLEKKNTILFSAKRMKYMVAIISLSLLFSGSRIGWIFAVLYIVFRLICNIISIIGSKFIIKRHSLKIMFFFGMFVLFGFVVAVYLFLFKFDIVKNLVTGIGLFGQSSHSSTFRTTAMEHVFELFLDSPFLGCSLGDLTPRLMEKFPNSSQASCFVILEQFAATGIVGGISILVYISKLCCSYKNTIINRINDNKYSEVLKGMCLGFFFQTIMLNMNQNILRPYYWTSMAVISAVFSNMRNMSKSNDLQKS